MMQRDTPTRIVAGVDGGQASMQALRWAWRQAQSTDAALSAVIAWHQPALYTDADYAGIPPPFVDWERAARLQLEETLRETLGEDGLRSITRVVTWGRPAAVLTEAAADADLLVVGTPGHNGFIGTLSGSVSLHLAHNAPCPLTIVPSPRYAVRPQVEVVLARERAMTAHDAGVGKIVVGVDGSPSSLQALRWASHQARATGARLEAVNVYARSPQPIQSARLGAPGGIPYGWRGNAELGLHHAVVDALGYQAAEGVTETVLEGQLVPALIAAGTDANMMVVGSGGHGALVGLLLGSVSTLLSEHPPCPLTIIRAASRTSQPTTPHASWQRRARSPSRSEIEGGHYWRP